MSSKRARPPVCGLVGASDAGKTVLAELLIRHLTEVGLRVGYVKHASHGADLERPGSDSHRTWRAGAAEVLLVEPGRIAYLSRTPDHPPPLHILTSKWRHADVVLAEGFSHEDHPKIRVRLVGSPPREAAPPIVLDLERSGPTWTPEDVERAATTVIAVLNGAAKQSATQRDQSDGGGVPMDEYLPDIYLAFRERYPGIAAANDALGAATREAGPLEERTQRLIRLGIAIGAEADGAVKASVRKALEQGITADEIRHVAMLAVTTAGFPTAIAGLDAIEEVLDSR